jgi:20S proteasome alpha/beta subunit
MTLIVGIKCADGIVVGADGAATLGALGRNTVRQPVKKLVSIRKALIFGLSGPVGMSQFLQHEVEELWDANSFKGNSLHAMGLIRDKIKPHLLREIAVVSQTQTVLGSIAHLSALSATMVAGKFSGTLSLFQFDQQGSPEQATENLPFVAIGSGQSLADPLLSFLRRIFWPTRLPTLAEGVLATLWCLKQAIDTNAGGVAEPI